MHPRAHLVSLIGSDLLTYLPSLARTLLSPWLTHPFPPVPLPPLQVLPFIYTHLVSASCTLYLMFNAFLKGLAFQQVRATSLAAHTRTPLSY